MDKVCKCEYIVVGLIKVLFILDKVIVIICGSKDKKDVKKNLVFDYVFIEE